MRDRQEKIMECVPNFSEGRDREQVEQLAACFRGVDGVKLLDYSADADHNRCVITALGQPQPLVAAVLAAMGQAVASIDLTAHQGEHPRIGAVDVVPFVPLQNVTMEEAVACARQTGEEAARRYQLPVYLYEQAATASHRVNLAEVRRGGFAGLTAKLQDPAWQPDFGPPSPHPTAGAVAVGARVPLVAFNVNLHCQDLVIAQKIAARVRQRGGGLAYVKAIGIDLHQKGQVQVSMNLTDTSRTALYQAVEMVRMEAARYGVAVAGGELIGLMPLQALADTAAYYLGLEELRCEQILESHF